MRGGDRPRRRRPMLSARWTRVTSPRVGRVAQGLAAAMLAWSALVRQRSGQSFAPGSAGSIRGVGVGGGSLGTSGGEVVSDPVSVGQTGSGTTVPGRLGSGLLGLGLGVGACWDPVAAGGRVGRSLPSPVQPARMGTPATSSSAPASRVDRSALPARLCNWSAPSMAFPAPVGRIPTGSSCTRGCDPGRQGIFGLSGSAYRGVC